MFFSLEMELDDAAQEMQKLALSRDSYHWDCYPMNANI